MKYEVYEYVKWWEVGEKIKEIEISDISLSENIWEGLKKLGLYSENLIIDEEQSSSYCIYVNEVVIEKNVLTINQKYKLELPEEEL